MIKNTVLILTVLLASRGQAAAQSNAEIAGEKLTLAIELMDQGVYDQSIALLDEAEALDPGSYIYSYEKAYAYYHQEDYAGAIRMLKQCLKHKNATDQVYQMLGNSYDMAGNPKKALSTYKKGMKKFPGSGRMYLESGIVYFNQRDYNAAVAMFEEGMGVDPYYPSNYFRAAQVYLNSGNKAYGMKYGETFMNLERNTPRTATMSEWLYGAYVDNITFPGDSTVTVSFSNNVINLAGFNLSSFSAGSFLTFPIVYEMSISLAVAGEKQIDMASLVNIRRKFLENWFGGETDYNDIHPTPVFDYQRKVIAAGHFEAYTYWILMKGDEDAFGEWYDMEGNEEKYDAFVDWFNENQLTFE